MADTPLPPELKGLDPGALLTRALNYVEPSPGAGPWVPPTPEELDLLLPQYRVECLLGRGGMGAVYKATQPTLDRPVAIKLLSAEMSAQEQFVLRFQREARTLAQLHHPGIVTIYESGRIGDGHLYFVMEYVEGTDLRRILQGPGLNPDQALELTGQICDALQAAHKQGVIHRDIKPENILISRDGHAKLADFGLSRPISEDACGLTCTNMVMGTPDYMSPEQRTGNADERTDVFALGVVLYEMLTGRPPLGAFEPPSRKVQVDVRLDEVVIKALQEEPSRRYQNVSEMKTAVDHIRLTPPPSIAPPIARKPRARNMAMLAAAAVVLLGIAGLFLWLNGDARGADKSQASTAATNQSASVIPAAEVAKEERPAPAPAAVQAVPSAPPARSGETSTGGAPTAAVAPAANAGGADITISCSDVVRITSLESGCPRLNDANLKIGNINVELSGWQFTSIPARTIISYKVRVNQGGFLYAFGGSARDKTVHIFLGAEEVDNDKWENANGAIDGNNVHLCLRRRVVAGEIINLKGLELQLTAKHIHLDASAGNKEAQPDTQPPIPAPIPAVALAPAANAGVAAVTISCSQPVRILPLEVGQQAKYDMAGWSIKHINLELSGWQFLSVPHRALISYDIHINQNGVLYTFGSSRESVSDQGFLGSEDNKKWEDATDAISGPSVKFCFRRKIFAGEIIKLKGTSLQLAARSIELVRDGKVEQVATSAVPSSSSAPAPSQPWTNSLGMKFVPVPGTSVQFSIWDTRVQDYQVFVTATGRSWEKPPFEQSPTHPAVMIRWEDAKAFCAWLTEKERRAGTLTSTQEYRLPTDEEWSTAVGLAYETGSTPEKRDGKIEGVYPWGTQWPPPRGTANCDPRFNIDDFDKTSPVGSFAANRFGLYDMGGNVKQWCEDFYNGRSGNRILRGSGWGNMQRHAYLSSVRDCPDSNKHRSAYGFRCVLTGGGMGVAQVLPSPSSAAATRPATANPSTVATLPPTPAPSMTASSHTQTDANQSPTKILSQQALNATAWALAPLDQAVPGDIRQNLTALREDLLDEGKAAPKANADAYKLGSQLCNNLLTTLDERDQACVRAGYRAAQADANTKVTSPALEAYRNYMMSWPQYAREVDQRGEIQRQQTNGANLVKESVKVDWANRSAVLRKALDAQYARYRDALRQSGK